MAFARIIQGLFRPARAVVLMYHRIAEPAVDPWQLSVTSENFESHLNLLSSSYHVISTSDLLDNLEDHRLQKNSVCITFDDGYQDNYLYALPLLEKFRCPATFFIATGSVGSNEPYWWDMLSDIFLLQEKLPGGLQICFNDKHFDYQLDNNGAISENDKRLHALWHWPAEPPTQRSRIYLELWLNLRDLPAFMIKDTITRLKEWSAFETADKDGNFPMSRRELLEMSRSSLVETGAHTVTHAALAAFPRQLQEAELAGSTEFLDENLGRQPGMIAYPYGNYNQVTLEVARNSGLKAAFTTEPKPVSIHSDLFQLGRFQVVNQNGKELRKQLNSWFNN